MPLLFSNPPPGPPPYTTGAVRLDGTSWLENPAAVMADSTQVTYSLWFRSSQDLSNAQGTMFVSGATTGAYQFACLLNNSSPPASAPGFGGQFTTAMYNIDESYGLGNDVGLGHETPVYNDGNWHNVIASFDALASAAPLGGYAIYIDGVLIPYYPGDPGSGTRLFPFNGWDFWIGYDSTPGDQWIGELADIWVTSGVSILDSTGMAIPPASLAKFYNAGAPVDLGANGQLGPGGQPAIFLRRAPSAAASTFGTNLGTAGDFDITGTLTSQTGPS